ncbi:MAG: hypothetical protein ABFC77_07865 [Thermoguttaceae bacterium]
MRRLLCSLALVVWSLTASGVCSAADTEPKTLAVVSFGGYQKLINDVATVGRLVGSPNLGKQLEMMALMLPQGEGSQGPLAMDPKRPWGLVVLAGDPIPTAYAFLPVADLKPLIRLFEAQSGREIKKEKGVYQIPTEGRLLYAAQKGDWAYIADSEKQLDHVVADPAPLLGDLPSRYNLAARVFFPNLPKEYRDQILAILRAGTESSLQQKPGANDEEYALRLGMARRSAEQLTMFVSDMDDLVLGWNVDPKTKTTYLDLHLAARPGTKLAEQFSEIKLGKTQLAGLAPSDATVSFNSVGAMSDAQAAQAKNSLADLRKSVVLELGKQGLAPNEVKLVSQLFGDVLTVLEKTVDTKKTDTAVAVTLEPGTSSMLAAAVIADGSQLEKSLKQFVAEAKKTSPSEALKLSHETYQNFQLHLISLPAPHQELATLVGDNLEVVVGIADDRAMMAAGHNAVQQLKKAIDRCKAASETKEVPPMRLTVSVLSVAKLLSEIGETPETKAYAGMIATFLASAGPQDHLTLTTLPASNSVHVRLEAEQGLLKALGSTFQMLNSPPSGAGHDAKH